ncbi:anti-sigma factor [Dactylosporangium sp. NPDC051485]|uniref:anti-sigma factor n=1 Tax=Dactylosporangium sp. NPDC051485 TaxID=3154846 RepID=UPI003434295A
MATDRTGGGADKGSTNATAQQDDARRRGRKAVIGLVIAVAAAAGAGGAGLDAVLAARDDGADCRAQDARVRLEVVGGPPGGGTGYACVRTVDDQRRVVVRADGMAVQRDGDYEAWLLDGTGPGEGVVALGRLGRGPSLALSVPAAMDIRRYNIVDISIEPHDGTPGHSGRSVLRGRLP